MPMTEAEFTQLAGYPPENDDLDRVNCERVGVPGHFLCGMCSVHEKPRTVCGCLADNQEDSEAVAVAAAVLEAKATKVKVSLSIDDDVINWLDTLSTTGVNRSRFVNIILRRAMNSHKQK